MAITNYVVQCEMIFYFIRSVREFVKQKQYPSIDAAIKVSLWICLLYSTNIFVHLFRIFMTSVATAAMAIFNMASNAIFGKSNQS